MGIWRECDSFDQAVTATYKGESDPTKARFYGESFNYFDLQKWL